MKQSSFFLFATLALLQTSYIQADDEDDLYDPETGCKIVDTVEDFDIDIYASAPWYIHQQQEIEYLPIENNYCVKAEYNVRDKPTFPWGYTVEVTNTAQNEFGAEIGGSGLCAYQTGNSGRGLSKLAVAPCFLPKAFAGPYWVIDYNEEEGYALISGGQPTIRADEDDIDAGCRLGTGTNDSGLWIFSRNQTRDDALVEKVRAIAVDAGFDITVLNDVDQTDCDGDFCEDSDEDFTIWWAGTVDCEFVAKYPFFACFSASDKCPKTCNAC